MRKISKFALSLLSVVALCSCGNNSASALASSKPSAGGDSVKASDVIPEKEVSKISMEKNPDKTAYFYDEELDLTGGSILVTYADGTTESVSLSDKRVTVEGNTSKANSSTKTITVRFGGKRTTFRITVSEQGFVVTFDLNYDGDTDIVVNVTKGAKVSTPNAPTRSGYTFYSWYVDKECTAKYDFGKNVSADMTLYASWKNEKSHEVTYDLNYYGVNPQTYTQIVQDGEKPRVPAVETVRTEYSFTGWYKDSAATSSFDEAIKADTTIYAGWRKTKTGASTYKFEAEDTNMLGKVGPGFSGEAIGKDMIVTNASGITYVSYLYKQGLSVDFYLASDMDAKATLTLNLAEEFSGITLIDSTWQIRHYTNKDSTDFVNVRYGSVSLNGPEFKEALTVEVDLRKGYNLIQLYTNNSVNPNGEGNGTFAGTAPNVDYMKLTTEAVVTWDGNYSLPYQY